jgi:hypothetical protein
MNYYPDDFINFYMHHNKSNPRYAGLARKAIHHYLGDLYNPETFDFELEVFFRRMIKGWIELKVHERIPYDWPDIDNFMCMVLHGNGYTHITYDKEMLKKGYHGVMRGQLPQHHA